MTQKQKNKKISTAIKATKEKRKTQTCKVFELKADKSRFSGKSIEQIKRFFLEAKWFFNYSLSQENIFKADSKIKEVEVKIKEKLEKRDLYVIGGQIKQGILSELWANVKSLSIKKKKGKKVGRIKFKSRLNSINLKQHGHTYKIQGNRLKVQGITQWFRVQGVKQLIDYEIANTKFIQKAGNFYFHVTCYKKKEKKEPNTAPLNAVAIDFGIKNQITISENLQLNYSVEMSRRYKHLCRKLSKKEKFSKNWQKAKILIEKEYNKTNNQKKDIKNKILHILKDKFNPIIFQNDCMSGWQKLWGKRMFHTGIGGIIADLRKSATAIKVDRFFPSTKRCYCCHHIQNVKLDERIFKCERCNYIAPRDLNSTYNIMAEGLKKIGVEYTELMPVEIEASTLRTLMERFNAIPRLRASLVRETGSLVPLGIK